MPIGPRVEDNSEGKTAAGRTYADLLKNDYDADLLEYYSTSQLGLIQVGSRYSFRKDSPVDLSKQET